MADETPVSDLRDWAKGLYGLEAATELLIRAGLAQEWRPWVKRRDHGGWWVDFDAAPTMTGELSGGAQRLVALAASLAGNATVGMGWDEVAALDRDNVALVLAAVSHAAGTQEHLAYVDHTAGVISRRTPQEATLYPWPE